MDERGVKIGKVRQVEVLRVTPGLLIILTGPTAAGKTEIRERMIKAENSVFRPLVTTTSRIRRESEREGIDYHFVTPTNFVQRLEEGQFVEHAEYGGNLYGTTKEELERVLNGERLISTMEISGAATFATHVRGVYGADDAEKILSKTIILFIDPISKEAQRKRYEQREKGLGAFAVRDVQDQDMMEEYADRFTHKVPNRDGELEQTLARVKELIEEQFEDLSKEEIS